MLLEPRGRNYLLRAAFSILARPCLLEVLPLRAGVFPVLLFAGLVGIVVVLVNKVAPMVEVVDAAVLLAFEEDVSLCFDERLRLAGVWLLRTTFLARYA